MLPYQVSCQYDAEKWLGNKFFFNQKVFAYIKEHRFFILKNTVFCNSASPHGIFQAGSNYLKQYNRYNVMWSLCKVNLYAYAGTDHGFIDHALFTGIDNGDKKSWE